MREIKFRAWQDGQMLTQTVSGIYGAKRFLGHLYEDCKLMQYTGLKDKNGAEIYEGDIMRYVDIDEYGDSRSEKVITVAIQPLDVYINTMTWIPGHGEVIGNVHENKELLK